MTVNCGVFGDRHVIVTVTITEETPYLSAFLATMTIMTLMTMNYRRFLGASSGRGWWHSALRRSGTPARLLQTLRPTGSFGHPLDQAQCGPRVPKSRVVAARQLLVLVATPL